MECPSRCPYSDDGANFSPNSSSCSAPTRNGAPARKNRAPSPVQSMNCSALMLKRREDCDENAWIWSILSASFSQLLHRASRTGHIRVQPLSQCRQHELQPSPKAVPSRHIIPGIRHPPKLDTCSRRPVVSVPDSVCHSEPVTTGRIVLDWRRDAHMRRPGSPSRPSRRRKT